MGVKGLWRIITPYGDKISIVTLQGKQIAVDLSGWICENNMIQEKHRMQQSKLHIRNIFFRTSVLVMSNVTPVFVLDGDPPDIKQSTLSKRNQTRFDHGNAGDVYDLQKPKGQRKILKSILRECQELLNYMGLCCVWSKGEGEALCALLDHKGVVDGVITQDSDAFLYGARKVYRNFTVHCGFGTVEMYKILDLEKHLNLSKEKLIAMSILCGCDYDDTGVHGIGPEKSLKYLSNFEGDVLKRLECIKTDKELERYDAEKSSCKKCHHPGKQPEHIKFGCELCKTKSKCIQSHYPFLYDNLSDEEKLKIDFELKLRKEIQSNPKFPDKVTINEYLHFTQEIPKQNFQWRKPDIVGFLAYMENKCNWSIGYALEKIIPIYCRWALVNSEFTDFRPCKILKKRVLKAVPSFDVQWTKKIDLSLYLDISDIINSNLITTIEPEALIMDKCKELYNEYLTDIENKKLAKKKTRRINGTVKGLDDLTERVERLTLKDSNCSQTIKRRRKKKTKIQCANFDKENSKDGSSITEESEKRASVDVSFGKKGCETGFDLDDSRTVDYDISEYEIDESFIVNNIIARRKYY